MMDSVLNTKIKINDYLTTWFKIIQNNAETKSRKKSKNIYFQANTEICKNEKKEQLDQELFLI